MRRPESAQHSLIELKFSPASIEILDREGQARRHQTKSEFRFDNLPEVLRAVGAYIDNNRGQLLRLSHCSLSDQDDVEVEYQTGDGDIRKETLSMSAIREIAVDMYKRRSRLSNRIGMVTR